ncbi:uncharacterized protein LOC115534111 isoform X4 [Gadus morhua]|uniref:uncharacterized protein LOC115534111 isoform X4 n=1 Tax=Gadus morhua TaxID=8049 RepID=UPI0011B5F040|nr:uncharacterized protein LOC115534111 isoform X4 [Gadus morhua]
MVPSPSCRDTSINDECYKPTSSDHGRTELVAGDCISLSCGALSDCSNITWLFSYNNTMTVELVDKGKVRSEYKEERVCITKECSLEVKKMRKEDEGPYTCRSILSSGGYVDHLRYDLKLIKSTHRPTTTKVKVFLTHGVANTACTSTSKPTTTPVKGAASSSPAARPSTSTPTTHTLNGAGWGRHSHSLAAECGHWRWNPEPLILESNTLAPTAGVLQLRVLVLLGFSVLTLVVLLRLIGWWRTRGNRAATKECIGLNSASDAPPARERLGPGASDQVFISSSSPVGLKEFILSHVNV